eukprot:TRINITY_DN5139_c0_g2_i1.p1 TRINITY_DN5139_c0_g2~~TRINITY_DN5139_c0_g2_i1.p1  ORF type:complete len:153 (-),score=12.35 TRINITY_DN5139_c0_g2_i1:117-575(-)
MGKEFDGPKRKAEHKEDINGYVSKQYIQQIISREWSSPTTSASSKRIIEDGRAVIIIKEGLEERRVTCKRLKNRGNPYKKLARVLRNKRIIPVRKNKSLFFLKKGFFWEPVDEVCDTFDTGDHILIRISPSKCRIISTTRKDSTQTLSINNV